MAVTDVSDVQQDSAHGRRRQREAVTAEILGRDRTYLFWALQLGGWTGWVVLFALRDVYWGQPLDNIILLWIDALVGMALTTGMALLYRAVWDQSLPARALTVVVGSYLFAAVWQPVKNYAMFAYYGDFATVDEYGWTAYFNGIIGYSYFLFLCWSGLYFGVKFYLLLQEERARSIKAEAMAHEAQLRMLRYQLNPHFLFNTLNALSTLILERNTETANQMVQGLSSFLRYSLDKDALAKVDLDHEVNTMKLYLGIEQVRFGERLTVDVDVDDTARDALVPSLLLQPLVENSIKHAVANREDGGSIRIRARVSAGRLVLTVCDDGPGLQPGWNEGKAGVGLRNTQDRLLELYGPAHDWNMNNVEPHGLCIEMRMPFETRMSGDNR